MPADASWTRRFGAMNSSPDFGAPVRSPSRTSASTYISDVTWTWRWSGAIVMSVTVPTVTPRNLTGEPTSSPCTDSSKKLTAGNDSRRKRLAPGQKSEPSSAPTATSTKSPSFQWLVAVVAISRGPCARIEERAHVRVRAPVAERRGLAARDDAARARVHHDAVSNDREDAAQLVR